ncbi:MAG TPA: UbiA family prenyltransferase [Gemmatimonadaceae bacterium]|nr:UbiA family prenyltransferase [Gemmatimonadaceae bacterium]
MTSHDDRARSLTAARRVGYRLLPGEAFSYILHLRPREWPIMAVHTALGFFLARSGGAPPRGATPGALAVALIAWVVCLNGGTLALNSAFDRDDGDIGYLDAPPPPPQHLALWGIALMAVGQGIALLLPREFAIAYVICVVLSLLYSAPPVRLKSVGGADWIINMVGFGALTPYAGWAATGRPLTSAAGWTFVAFALLFAALYPLTQLYQLDEDLRRGDRTLAVVLGMRRSLGLALGAAAAAFLCFARAARLYGAGARGWLALALAAAAWSVVLVPWLVRCRRMSGGEHKRGMYAALIAWAITDGAILAVAFLP